MSPEELEKLTEILYMIRAARDNSISCLNSIVFEQANEAGSMIERLLGYWKEETTTDGSVKN